MHFEKDKDEHVDLGEKKEKIKLQISAQLLNLVREYKKKKKETFLGFNFGGLWLALKLHVSVTTSETSSSGMSLSSRLCACVLILVDCVSSESFHIGLLNKRNRTVSS